ncbi:MAG: hypothetical protein PHY23_06020, partial [Oscillospiraceae bacterium]|nr:hypothetical protein [Oscillospiraceae bacterium]
MKTKKWLSLLLASLMMLSVLAGCGNGTQTPSAEPSVTPSGVPAESVSPTSGQEKTKINLALLSGPTGVG